MSLLASTTITVEPALFATIAAGIPVAPAPMITTSASRSQRWGACGACAAAGIGAISPPVATAAPATPAFLIRSRRVILFFDFIPALPNPSLLFQPIPVDAREKGQHKAHQGYTKVTKLVSFVSSS